MPATMPSKVSFSEPIKLLHISPRTGRTYILSDVKECAVLCKMYIFIYLVILLDQVFSSITMDQDFYKKVIPGIGF